MIRENSLMIVLCNLPSFQDIKHLEIKTGCLMAMNKNGISLVSIQMII